MQNQKLIVIVSCAVRALIVLPSIVLGLATVANAQGTPATSSSRTGSCGNPDTLSAAGPVTGTTWEACYVPAPGSLADILMIDLTMAGGAVRGTGSEQLADGLTPEQRTAKLIQFLREGAFRWRFIEGPTQIITVGAPTNPVLHLAKMGQFYRRNELKENLVENSA